MQPGMSIAFALALFAGQTGTDVRQLFDAGRYQEVVKTADQPAVENEEAARLQYLKGQSYAKVNDTDGARRAYERLAGSHEKAWASIGKSALQLIDKQLDESLESANQAVSAGDSLPESHYQRGMALMGRKDYPEAATSFTKATQLDPNFASAYYYAGLANYRIKRIDLMTNNFEKFVRLAPNAPERPEIDSILRTVRGR